MPQGWGFGGQAQRFLILAPFLIAWNEEEWASWRCCLWKWRLKGTMWPEVYLSGELSSWNLLMPITFFAHFARSRLAEVMRSGSSRISAFQCWCFKPLSNKMWTSSVFECLTDTAYIAPIQWGPDKWDSIEVEFSCKWDSLDGTKVYNPILHTTHKWDSYVSGTLNPAHRVSHLSSPYCTRHRTCEAGV